jgi:uncharacterized phage protein gp47/JayE
MPWVTPTLDQVRKQNRDYITARLHSSAMIPNSVLRVLADGNAGLAFLVLLYIDWLALQLLPDTAETEWLDRHAAIWLPANGRKPATFASGSGTVTGINGSVLPESTQLVTGGGVLYETTAQIIVGEAATPVNIRAIDAGVAGNLDTQSSLSFVNAIAGIDGAVVIITMDGGVDAESDDELRQRVLERIREPPMGGSASDYVQWALQVPGVTRAWCAPNEMGIGTVTVRVMMDDLRADNGGFPTEGDLGIVTAYMEEKRPVAVKDFWVLAPIPEPLDLYISNLVDDTEATRAAIEASVEKMLFAKASPGQTIYRSWVSEAVSQAIGEDHHDLTFSDHVMPSLGHLAVLSSIIYS